MNILKKYYHWFVMVSCCLMASASVGFFTNAYGVFYTPLSEHLHVGRGVVAMHATIAGLITGFLGPFVVRCLKKIRLQFVIGFGVMLLLVSTLLTAYADRVWQLNLLGILRGIGCGCYYVPVITIILGNWFQKYYGTVSGITLSFSGIAGAVLSPCLSVMIGRFGYQRTLLISVAIILVLSLPGVLICRLHPEEIGMHALGWKAQDDESSEQKESEMLMSKVSFFSPSYIILCAIGFLALAIIGLTQHMTGYSESIGMGTAVGVAMMSSIMVGNIVMKLLMGILSDIFGSIRTCVLFLVTAVFALVVLLIQPANSTILIAVAFLIGGTYAVGNVGLAGVSRDIYGLESYGEVFAVVSTFSCVSSSLALTVIGYTYDLTQGYTLALGGGIVCGVLSIAGLLILNKYRNKEVKAS